MAAGHGYRSYVRCWREASSSDWDVGDREVERRLCARGILLTAPPETLVDRLATRTSNSFGKSPEDLSRILDDIATVEPFLRRAAD